MECQSVNSPASSALPPLSSMNSTPALWYGASALPTAPATPLFSRLSTLGYPFLLSILSFASVASLSCSGLIPSTTLRGSAFR